tara:strand:+ start:201 stop:1079 length:879 start_codon:yes stop_codon:yes gene_type:complete
MSVFSNLVRKVSAPVATFTSMIPHPAAQVTSRVAGEIARDTARRDAERAQEIERNKMINFDFGGTPTSALQNNLAATTPRVSTASSGSGFFDTFRSGVREFGGLVTDIFNTGLPSLFGMNRSPNVLQQPAVTTTGNIGASETSSSGTVDAGAGAVIPFLTGGIRNLLKSPGGALAIGTGAGLLGGMMDGSGKKMRITRKMKSQARMILNMTGGDLAAAAQILNIDQNLLVFILLKRFRNDGPMITKAAMRKTKQTIRRLHNMQDVLKSITPTSTGRRRAPVKRAMSTTLIKN